MKGTGTHTDPFIIMTIDDLYSMEELGGPEVCCRLGADIELNGTPYAENFVPIPVNWSSFDGNGHKIRNIYVSDLQKVVNAFRVMISGKISISGLMLENAVLCGSEVNLFRADTGINATVDIYDCAMILKISHHGDSCASGSCCMLHGKNLTVSSDLSVIAVSAVINRGYPLIYGGNVRRTQIVLDLLIHDEGNAQLPETSFFRHANASDSWITGSIHCDSEASDHIFNMSDSYSVFSNFYQAVAMKNIDCVYCSGDYVSACFYDNDLMAGAERRTLGYGENLLYGLTTDQCKDPEYLTSIGFVCR